VSDADQHTHADATTLLRVIRGRYEAENPGVPLRTGTRVDVAGAARESMELSPTSPRYQAAVAYLISRGALEPDPPTYNRSGGPLYVWGPHADDLLLAEE
jgi:hypothetical protein